MDLADFPDNHFDLVLDGHCLHCIIGDDRRQFFASALRVLKPEGVLQIKTMCGEPVDEFLKQSFDFASRSQVIQGVGYRYCGLPDDILAEIKQAGFEVVQWQVLHQEDGRGEDMLPA